MVIFFKCSFRSSHGYKLSSYNVNRQDLIYLSEKSNSLNGFIPKTIEYTLSNELGRCLVLATDENSSYFLGVLGLVEGNDDKYVNAVFYDSDNPQRIIALYDYFCNNQFIATKKLLNAVLRSNNVDYSTSELEYTISNEKIRQILSEAELNVSTKVIRTCSSNILLSFVTTDEYNDYQIALEEKFNTSKMFRCEHYNTNSNNIVNYQLATKNVYESSFPIPLAIGGGIGVIGAIIALLIFLL